MREEIGLPTGMLDVDLEEAFDEVEEAVRGVPAGCAPKAEAAMSKAREEAARVKKRENIAATKRAIIKID